MHRETYDLARATLFCLLLLTGAVFCMTDESRYREPQTETIYIEDIEEPPITPSNLPSETPETKATPETTTTTTTPTSAKTTKTAASTTKATTTTAKPTTTTAATTSATRITIENSELEMLALIIYQEAGADYCSDETRLMVGSVVMNRIANSRYPDTMYEVVTQKGQYGRLYWTGLVWPDRASNPGEAHAVERAYNIARRILHGERAFSTEDVVYQAEFPQGTEVVAYQDGMYFCR